MAYKQKGCTPITAKIQKGTKGGVTNPLLNVGVPMKVAPLKVDGVHSRDKKMAERRQSIKDAAKGLGNSLKKAAGTGLLGVGPLVASKAISFISDSNSKKKTAATPTGGFSRNGTGATVKNQENPTKAKDTPGIGAVKSKGPRGKSGSDLRKAEYDKKGWKYDETIKGYNKSGNKINDNKTAKVRAPKVSVESKLTKAPSYDTSKITGKPKASATAKPSKKVNRKQKAIDVKLTKAKAARASGNDKKADRKERAAQRKKDRLTKKESVAKNYKKGYYGK